ncbi:LysR family transcriptional regulator [Marinomonas sp. 15G1-11]|uniref:LysR family transcriptional regulator n=1 Tax=Marinomonas phaeophyticola TaxID=3004091 RepID=A0ABT4JPH6_9GAMM|nr:LysR family transcriptional regulator [Marinomonas sp. 15G1-11]MCZ2720280.1 LysR family transcriptional regulator [Marinomonas sp. 15G1-11]
MDKLTAARVFIDVAYSNSFTLTADKLNMSRPMVTRYIETIEDWLGVRLLHRTTRKISLTTAGKESLKDIEAWVAQADHIVHLTSNSDVLSGAIRITTSMSFGIHQLLPAIQDFMNKYTQVQVNIELEDSVTDMIEQSIDLAIRIASTPHPSLIGKPIAICESVLVASPEYLNGKTAIKHPQDLQNHDCLGYKNHERYIWNLSKNEDFEAVAVTCRLSANEATVLLNASLKHAGITLQPKYLANTYIKTGELTPILPEWKPNDLTIYALYSSRKHLSPTVRALIDHLEHYFSNHPW